jgi:hypothetical protein
MGQFIDQHQGWAPTQSGVEVKFIEGGFTVQQDGAGQLFQAVEPLCGLGAAMGFHDTGEDIAALGNFTLRRRQHGAGLAYTGIGAEVDTQFAAQGGLFFLLDSDEQGVGVGAFVT